MRRTTSLTCNTALTALLVSSLYWASACNDTRDAAPAAAEAAEAPRTETRERAPTPVPEPISELTVDAPAGSAPADTFVDEQPVLANALTPTTTTRPSTPGLIGLRDAAVLSAETPDANAAAFAALPLSKRDKPAIAGAGASGIHLDELELGKGWESSRCQDTGEHFVAGTDERVNLCFRVVHPREPETVTVEWAFNGKVRQQIEVSVRPTHSYLTRAWLPIRSGRAGHWTATVKSNDGTILGQREFDIAAGQE